MRIRSLSPLVVAAIALLGLAISSDGNAGLTIKNFVNCDKGVDVQRVLGRNFLAKTPRMSSDYQDDRAVDERSDCAERCITEHNCCIKSCNWVEPKKKSKCIKQCKSILKKCNRECDEKPVADKAKVPAAA